MAEEGNPRTAKVEAAAVEGHITIMHIRQLQAGLRAKATAEAKTGQQLALAEEEAEAQAAQEARPRTRRGTTEGLAALAQHTASQAPA